MSSPISDPRSNYHIKELDGLRGLAILFVMIFHFTADIPANSQTMRAVLKICSFGWIGVDLFFVLSGYLITGILLRTKGSPHFFRNFYARRTLRIFPLYYGVLFIIFIFLPYLGYLSEIQSTGKEQLWFWFYGTNLLIALKGIGETIIAGIMLTHLWTLAVEEHFYLFWPAIVRWAKSQKLILISVCIILVCALSRGLISYYFKHPLASYCLTPLRIDSLIMGALLAIFFHNNNRVSPAIRRLWIGTLAMSFSSLFVLALFRRGLHPHDLLIQTIGYPIIYIFFTAIIALALVAKQNAFTRSFLRNRFLTSLGKYSYGIYIYHVVIWMPLNQWFSVAQLNRITGSNEISAILHFFILSGASFVIAYLSWHIYENPFLKLKRFFEYQHSVKSPVQILNLKEPLESEW